MKFDQSGKNRLGESADLVQDNNNLAKSTRPIWGSWFGVNGNVVVDNNFAGNGEIIDSLDYRFTYVPKDSVMKVL